MEPVAREKLQLQVAQHRAFAIAEKQARGNAEKARDEAVQIAQQATRAIESMVDNAATASAPDRLAATDTLAAAAHYSLTPAQPGSNVSLRATSAASIDAKDWYLGDGRALSSGDEIAAAAELSLHGSNMSGSLLPPRASRRA